MAERSGGNSAANKRNGRKYRKQEYSLKKWATILITTAMVLGLIFPLFAEVIIGTIYPDHVRGVETWNQFTSVILGIVATVVSLVSMFMGFKSYNDSFELQKTCQSTLIHLKNVEKSIYAMRSMFYFNKREFFLWMYGIRLNQRNAIVN